MFVFQENFVKHGLAALNLTTEFDEMEVLKTNIKYIHNTLEVNYLFI